MKGFLIGFSLGLGLGVLFAPMRGKDVRVMAAVRASELADSARETYERVQGTSIKAATSLDGEDDNVSTGTSG